VLNKEIKICKILTFSQEDFLTFNIEFSTSGVDVIMFESDEILKDEKSQLIIVGWSNVKRLFPKQRISQNKISDNISWIYSGDEDKIDSIIQAKIMIVKILRNWLPQNYITYDLILDGKLSNFLENNFTKPYKFYLYFSGKAMYLYNDKDPDKILGISLESFKYAGVNVKKSITTIIEKYSPICLSYTDMSSYVSGIHNLNFDTIENLFWARHYEEISEKNFYDFLMDVDSDKYIPFLMAKLYNTQTISEHEQFYINRLLRKDVITDWLSNRELFFDKKYINEKINFKKSSDNSPYVKLNYSNKRTITGRINCADRQFNPQNLPKESEDRKMIVSRFENGKIAAFDYVSFETKLSLFLSQDKSFIQKYKDKDLHEETAKVIFAKKEINQQERSIGKSINHALIYGGGDETLKKIIKDVQNPNDVLVKVKKFLEPIIDKSEQIKISFEELGYMINSFGTIIRPQKAWAPFNNFVQAMAADILVEKLYDIKEFLSDKKSKFLFQVHDSFIFDIHPDELNLIEDIKKMLSSVNNLNFQVEESVGDNLYECTSVKEVLN